jgi:hypothetical protein
MPNISKYKKIKDILAAKQGEKWWIHLQQRENTRLIHDAQRSMFMVNNYINYLDRGNQPLARAMKSHLSYFAKQLLFYDSFPISDFLNIFLSLNVGFNTVFWGNLKISDSDPLAKETSELEVIFSEIASLTGGKTIIATEPEMGLREIKAHTDHFYELIYDFDGKMEEKKIHVLLNDQKSKLSYKNKFSKQEIGSCIQALSEKSVEVIDFSIKKNQVTFSIKSFKRKREKKYGLLKVRMRLFDKHNFMVYSTENTLRASENEVTVSIPLPPEHRGEFKLNITIFDLIANTLTSQDHRLTLN